jgi:hypothetical protein
MKSRELETTQDEFEGLHAALDSVRESTSTVKVNKEALRKILRDYGCMVAELKWQHAPTVTMEDLL